MKLTEWVSKNGKIFCASDLNFLLKNLFKNKNIYKLDEVPLEPAKLNYLENIKKIYAKGMPLAYILKKEEFYGEIFFVNKDTLIPRPSTELLVEEVLKIIDKTNPKTILDLGCGCSNIGISIAKNIKNRLFIFCSDISYPALKVSKKNILKHKVDIKLICADTFLPFKEESFDIIVSNPPYVEEKYLKNNKYLSFEPKIALDGGKSGVDFIFKIIKEGYNYLKKGGFLVLEVGEGQRKKIDRFKGVYIYSQKYWVKDYNKIDRVLVLKK